MNTFNRTLLLSYNYLKIYNFISLHKYLWGFAFFLMVLPVTSQDKINPNGYNKFYFKNGTISSEGNFKNGKPEGYWKTYYPSGSLKSEGYRKNHLLDSIWNFYSEEGVLLSTITYEKDKREGITKNYSSEGFLVSQIPYKNDLKHGVAYQFYENNGLKSVTHYLNGKKDGMAYEYNREGLIVRISEFEKDFIVRTEVINQTDKNGEKEGMWKEFYPDSTYQVKQEGTYLKGVKHGYFREYSKSGVLLSTTKYEYGEVVENAEELQNLEIKTTYHSNGAIKSVKSFKDGLQEGVEKTYDPQGNIVQSKIYSNGKLLGEGIVDAEGIKQGDWKEYYPRSGKLRAEGAYKNGARIGKWTFYFENGKIEQKGTYREGGLPHGLWTWYYPSGQILREEEFRLGKEDGYIREYDPVGNVITKGQFLDGYEEGEWVVDYGDHREEGKYIGGLKHGIWLSYYENDELAFEGEYVNGMAYGKHTYYYPNGKKKLQGKYSGGQKDNVWTRYNPDGSVMLKIEYEDGQEVKLDGFKIKPKNGQAETEETP